MSRVHGAVAVQFHNRGGSGGDHGGRGRYGRRRGHVHAAAAARLDRDGRHRQGRGRRRRRLDAARRSGHCQRTVACTRPGRSRVIGARLQRGRQRAAAGERILVAVGRHSGGGGGGTGARAPRSHAGPSESGCCYSPGIRRRSALDASDCSPHGSSLGPRVRAWSARGPRPDPLSGPPHEVKMPIQCTSSSVQHLQQGPSPPAGACRRRKAAGRGGQQAAGRAPLPPGPRWHATALMTS